MKIHIEKDYEELSEKAEEVKDFIEGSITKLLPVSILKLHKDLTVILDKESANALDKEIKQIIDDH